MLHVLHKCIEFNDVDVSVISNSYPITEQTMREVISLHVGQAGVQMGNLR